MALSFRHGTVEDLQRMHALVRVGSRNLYDDETHRLLPEVWRSWIEDKRAVEFHSFIDDSVPPLEQFQGYGLGVFVSNEFIDTLLQKPFPHVASEVVRREAAGRPVVLDLEQVASANAGEGVNALGLDFAMKGPWNALTLLRWSSVLFDSLRSWGSGWRIRSAVHEWVGRDVATFSSLSGWKVVHDFSKGLQPKPKPALRRYLSAITRESHQRSPARMPAALFFTDHAPRFHFTPAEKELLLLALRHCSDADAAIALRLSPHTVKARWKAIFRQVADQKPDWFPLREDDESPARGVEKRRHLLAWLTRHMEEVRPRARTRS